MTDLHAITLDQKIKAFEKAKEDSNITEGKLILLTEDYYASALNFARDSFTRDEPINNAVNTQWFKELEEMWLETFRCHMTLVVLNEQTDELMAIRGTRVLNSSDSFDASKIEDQGFRKLWGIIEYCDERAKFFERFGVEQAFQFFGFGVGRKYRNQGLGSKLFSTAIKMLQNLGLDSVCIKGETSSNFSSKIYEKNGFQKLYEKPYDEYLIDGEQVICNTGEHKSLKIYGRRLNKEYH